MGLSNSFCDVPNIGDAGAAAVELSLSDQGHCCQSIS
jgi:hypothetical protein